jgi:hypothetical protein
VQQLLVDLGHAVEAYPFALLGNKGMGLVAVEFDQWNDAWLAIEQSHAKAERRLFVGQFGRQATR